MKKILITLSAALALVSFVVLDAGSWSLDAGHSRLGFTVKHMEISETVGQFDKFDVKITTPNADFSDATIELTAEAKTVNTYLSMRDDHLRSADFFDVEKHPTITFKSTSVKKAKGNNYVIKGNFTMHGVTKTVVLAGVHNGTTKNRAGADLAGLKISGLIKRSEYGVGVTMPNTVVADEIYLNADLEVSKN
ncbi:MAG: polyisoprenoid-binding protein [Flavobacteriia bacterium]|jgi:polyisoprenoid-binding protein YceI|nr:polyisoprenoid-binding protein [Flavobacteriia bacterium]